MLNVEAVNFNMEHFDMAQLDVAYKHKELVKLSIENYHSCWDWQILRVKAKQESRIAHLVNINTQTAESVQRRFVDTRGLKWLSLV